MEEISPGSAFDTEDIAFASGSAGTGADEAPKKTKKRRRPNSCDLCRARKVKCEPTEEMQASGFPVCLPCREAEHACTYQLAINKKPRVSKKQQELRKLNGDSATPVPLQSTSKVVISNSPPLAHNPPTLDHIPPPDLNHLFGNPLVAGLPWDTASNLGRGTSPTLTLQDPAQLRRLSHSVKQKNTPATTTATLHGGLVLPPEPKLPTLTSLAPLPQIKRFLNLFFDHLHPLLPIVHKPSMMSAFEEGKYNWSPSYLGALTAVLSFTLLTIPKVYLGMEDVQTISMIAIHANSMGRKVAVDTGYDPPCLEWIVTRYLNAINHWILGEVVTGASAFGEAVGMSGHLGLDKPDKYFGLDRIEQQMRLRTYWMMYSSDKEEALFSRLPAVCKMDFGTLDLPAEVEDSAITSIAVFQDLQKKAPLPMRAFTLTIKVSVVLNDLLAMIRSDNGKVKPVGAALYDRLQQLKTLEERVIDLLKHAPDELQFTSNSSVDNLMLPPDLFSAISIPSMEPDFQSNDIDDFIASLLNTNALSATSWSQPLHDTMALDVLRANAHVTFLLIRIEIIKYRRTLIPRPVGQDGDHDMLLSVAHALLDTLLRVPAVALAVNGKRLFRMIQLAARALPQLLDMETASELVQRYVECLKRIVNEFAFQPALHVYQA